MAINNKRTGVKKVKATTTTSVRNVIRNVSSIHGFTKKVVQTRTDVHTYRSEILCSESICNARYTISYVARMRTHLGFYFPILTLAVYISTADKSVTYTKERPRRRERAIGTVRARACPLAPGAHPTPHA